MFIYFGVMEQTSVATIFRGASIELPVPASRAAFDVSVCCLI